MFAWNKDLYKKAGLDPDKAPTTREEISENAKKICALGDDTYGLYFSGGGCGGCMIFTFMPLTWGAGADILSEDGKKATLDTPQMRKAVGYYRDMVKAGRRTAGCSLGHRHQLPVDHQWQDRPAESGAFAIGTLVTEHPDIHFGVSLIPSVDGKSSSFAGGDNFVITKGSPRAAIAKNFLEYAYSSWKDRR